MPSDWMNEEKAKAETINKTGTVPNAAAPRLVRARSSAPKRINKNVYVQPEIWHQFEDLVIQMKRTTGQKGPDLLEEALGLLFKKHGVKVDFNK